MRRAGLAVVIAVLLAGVASPASAGAAKPFFMFGASRFRDAVERDRVIAVLRQGVRAGDYLSASLAAEAPELGHTVGRDRLFALPPSVDAATRLAGRCGTDGPRTIIYDVEHWDATPEAEQTEPRPAIAAAAKAVHAAGCASAGVAPDGRLVGFDPDRCANGDVSPAFDGLDWHGIDLVTIQAQVLASDRCVALVGERAYVDLVRAVAARIRHSSTQVKIVAQLTLRSTTPERAATLIHELAGTVDGFYIAYPTQPGSSACVYCSPEALTAVLAALGRVRRPS